MTYIFCNKNRAPEILEDGSLSLSLDGISLNNKQTPVCNDKMTHLAKNCVTLKELLDTFHDKQI